MKVVHISGSVSRKAGGLFNSVRRLAQEELSLGCDVEVLGGFDEFTDIDIEQWAPLKPLMYRVKFPAEFGFSGGITDALDEWMPDIVHVHGLWEYPSVAVRRWVSRNSARYIVSPRGMLDPWALHNSGWKKKLAGALYEKKNLQQADCVHALTDKEGSDIRNYGITSPVCVIPNGVDVPDREAGGRGQGSESSKGKLLLYIGRLHPKKGLEPLLKGWHIASKQHDALPGWQLVVAGWDDGGHERDLKKLVDELALDESVSFPGEVYGSEKDDLLRKTDAFILPSLSEGLPMSVLEAWAYGLPVLMTKYCNLPQGFTRGAALEIGTDAGSISGGLGMLFSMSDNERAGMGGTGRSIVQQDYSWGGQAEKMLSVYEWLRSREEAPDCIEMIPEEHSE